MVRGYAEKKGLKVIGVVRSQDRVKQLNEELGWNTVLNSSDPEFP